MGFRVKVELFCNGCGGVLLSEDTTMVNCDRVGWKMADRFKDRRRPKWMSDGDWEKLGIGPVLGMATNDRRWRQTKHFCKVCADDGTPNGVKVGRMGEVVRRS